LTPASIVVTSGGDPDWTRNLRRNFYNCWIGAIVRILLIAQEYWATQNWRIH